MSLDLPCPICGERNVVVMTCSECWNKQPFTETERVKIVLFERHAEMSEPYKTMFDALKLRQGMTS